MAPPLIQLKGITLTFGGTPLLNTLFAWQLWRWAHHEPCGSGSATSAASGGAKVAPVHTAAAAAIVGANDNQLQAAPGEAAQRPVIAPAGAPDAAFLTRCAEAAAAVAAQLVAARDGADRAQYTAAVERLRGHFKLRWEAAAAV